MALTFNSIVDSMGVVAPEVSQAQRVIYLNDRVGRLVGEGQVSEKTTDLAATTTAGQNTIALDTDTVDVRALRIGDDPYQRVTMQDIWDLEADRRELVGDGGVFAPYDESTLYVFPQPSEDGLAVTVIETLYPTDSAYGGTDSLATFLPKHLRHYARAGGFADVYRQTGREDLAQVYEQEFETGIDKVFKWRRTQLGSGPARVRVLSPSEYSGR